MDPRKNAMAAWSLLGRKKGISFLLPGTPMYSPTSLPPYNLVPRAFPSENEKGSSGSSHFLREKPWDEAVLPKHLPHKSKNPQESWHPFFTRRREHSFPNRIKQTIIRMACVQTPLFPLALLHQQIKGNISRSRSARSRLCQEEDFTIETS